MTYIPARNSNLFEDLIDDVFGVNGFDTTNTLMKTDIREKDGMYVLDIDMPGFKKNEISLSLYNGNLTISGEHKESKEEKDAKGTILRQERYSGSCSRSWYVGTAITDSDISASYNDGTLTVILPTEKKKETMEKKFISIL